METLGTSSNNLRGLLEESERFLTAVEIETSRGMLMSETSRRTVEQAKTLSDIGQLHPFVYSTREQLFGSRQNGSPKVGFNLSPM